MRFDVAYQVIGGTKFYERAEIKDALAYLTLLVEPGGRGLVRARRQLAQARHRPDDGQAACSRTRTRWASRSGDRRRARAACRASARRR